MAHDRLPLPPGLDELIRGAVGHETAAQRLQERILSAWEPLWTQNSPERFKQLNFERNERLSNPFKLCFFVNIVNFFHLNVDLSLYLITVEATAVRLFKISFY